MRDGAGGGEATLGAAGTAAEAVEIMAFGAHPDDVEIGAGGSLLKAVRSGYRIGIVDLSQGEAAANGTASERQKEAQAAAAGLGAKFRVNLGLPDGKIGVEKDISPLVRLLRQYRPRIVLAPWPEDTHPDHRAAAELLRQALFWAKSPGYLPEIPPHAVARSFGYFINGGREPRLVVDVSEHHREKLAVVKLHRSQFCLEAGRVNTRLNGEFLAEVASRERYYGSLVGVEYAEGFWVEGPVPLSQLLS